MKNDLFKSLTLALLSVFLLTACSKKDKEATPADPEQSDITGKYLVTKGLDDNIYVQISADHFYSYGATTDLDRRKATNSASYEQKQDTIIFDGYPKGKYHLKKDGGKLTLEPSTSGEVIILSTSSDTEVPNPEDLVKEVEVEELMSLDLADDGSRIEDVTSYNGYLYTNSYRNKDGNDVLAKISMSGTLKEEIPIPSASKTTLGRSGNIAVIGNQFWVVPGNPITAIIQFDPNTLMETGRINNTQTLGTVYTTAVNGDESRIYSSFYEGIRKWDLMDKKYGQLRELGAGKYSSSISITGDKLYEVRNNMIHEFVLPNLSSSTMGYYMNLGGEYRLENMVFYGEKSIYAIASKFDDKGFVGIVLLKITLP